MTHTIPHRLAGFAAAIIFVVAMMLISVSISSTVHASPDVEEKVLHDVEDHIKELGHDYHIGDTNDHHSDHNEAHSVDQHAEEHGESGLPQFDPSSFPSQIFWLFFFFAVMYLIFSKKTLPEISSVIENRRNHIESYTEEAEKLRAKAEETQNLYETGLESARKEAAQITYDLHEEIQEKAAHKNEFFIEQSKVQIELLEKKLDKEKNEALSDMTKIAAEIASAAAEKIVGIKTDIAKAQQVVESLSDEDNAKKKKAA